MILDSEEQQKILLKIVGLVGISGNIEEVKKTVSVFEQLTEAIQEAAVREMEVVQTADIEGPKK